MNQNLKMTKEIMMSEATAKDMIQHALDQNFNKANEVFGEIMSVKISDVLDQEKINIASQIYNGVDPEDPEDPEDEDIDQDDELDNEEDDENWEEEEDVETPDDQLEDDSESGDTEGAEEAGSSESGEEDGSDN